MCLCVGVDVGVFVCVHLRKNKMRRGKLSSLVVHGEEREKKVVHKCTIMHKLVWEVFCSNCVKVVSFSILHNYAQADVIALVGTRFLRPKEGVGLVCKRP